MGEVWGPGERGESWASLLPAVEAIAEEAAAYLRRALFAPTRGSEEAAPVDAEVETLLEEALRQLAPDFGFRGEECPELWRAPSRPDGPFFLIDPNDGTSAFQAGQRGASISIALISEGRPVLGLVNSYAARAGLGDHFCWAEGLAAPRRNGRAFGERSAWTLEEHEQPLLVSNSAPKRAEAWSQLLGAGCWRPAPGIAYRLALCAAGEASAALSLVGARDLDIAGGDALMRAVGGQVVDEAGHPLRYHFSQKQRTGKIYAGLPARCAQLSVIPWEQLEVDVEAQREDRPLRPSRARLFPTPSRLSSVLGGWWGARIGEQLARDDSTEALSFEQLARASAPLADARTSALRAALKQLESGRLSPAEAEQLAERLLFSARAAIATPEERVSDTEEQEMQADRVQQRQLEQRWLESRASKPEAGVIHGARLGATLGLEGIPIRWRALTLADYRGSAERWQGDGERLVEAACAALLRRDLQPIKSERRGA